MLDLLHLIFHLKVSVFVVVVDQSIIKKTNETLIKSNNSFNGNLLNQLQVIRERTKFILNRYQESACLMMSKIKFLNNSQINK